MISLVGSSSILCFDLQTGASIIIRGKGSVKEGKVGHKDGRPLPGQDEPLHAYVTASNPENVKKAVDRVRIDRVSSERIAEYHFLLTFGSDITVTDVGLLD